MKILQKTSVSQQTLRLLGVSSSRFMNDQQSNRPDSSLLKRVRAELASDSQALQWRTPVGDRPEDWNTKFKVFGDSEQTSDFIVTMQQPIDLSPKAIKRWWEKRKERIERHMQQYVPERHEILGPDLAAAHFLLYRGGAVKFVSGKNWIRANKDDEIDLPKKNHPAYKVEALRCDDMNLYYEGLENLRCLQHLKFLSYRNVKTFDDWYIDRVSGSQYPVLEVLDISGTKCTSRGLWCLYRIPTLKLLIVDNPKESVEYELTCALLEETIPKLKIIGAAELHELN